MKIVRIVARILIGLAFVLAGASGFILSFTGNVPPMPGLAGDFQKVIFASHFVLFIDGVQFLTGVALLANRYVPLALVVSAAILANILAFHLTMQPLGIFPGLVLCACWFVVALPLRDKFAPLLSAK